MLFLVLVMFSFCRCKAEENPCQDMTLADCRLGEDNIINKYPFGAQVCRSLCQKSDICSFWRVLNTENGPECLLLRTDYHQDCKTFSGPTLGSIQDCMSVDLATCWAYIWEECTYTGDRLSEFEPLPHDVSSVGECQEWAEILPPSVNATYFAYLSQNEECRIYSSLEASCLAVGGPESAPPIDQCWEAFTTTTTTATTTTPIDPQCHQPYVTLSQEWRKINYTTSTNDDIHSDRTLETGWYRFAFDNFPGAKIPLEPPAKEFQQQGHTCGAVITSWTPNSLPELGDIPKSIVIKFAWAGNDAYTVTNAKIVACPKDGHIIYLYYLHHAPDASAYCALTS